MAQHFQLLGEFLLRLIEVFIGSGCHFKTCVGNEPTPLEVEGWLSRSLSSMQP